MTEKPKQENKVKKFCFTLNNYTQEQYDEIVKYAVSNSVFAVIGKEVGKKGTPHLQGFINLHRQDRFTHIKKFMFGAHLELARGTDQQNLEYCTKQDENAVVFGEPQKGGKRNDLHLAVEAIKGGAKVSTVAREHSEVYVHAYRGLHALAEHLQQPRDVNDPPTTIWLWGKSGVGKTRFAFDQFPHDQIYVKDNTQWWNGYEHQQCILVDDFDGKWHFQRFLMLFDRYPYQGETKGGMVVINSPVMILTCEFAPSHFWSDNDLVQVSRRFQYIVELK